MWILTNKGYISIVAHRSKKDAVLVRARQREHLEHFAELIDEAFGTDANVRTPISEERPADYEFRFEAKRAAIAMVMASEIDAIDYTNFKNSVKDHFLHGVYFKAYNALLAIGDRTRRESGERHGRWGGFMQDHLPFSNPSRRNLVGGEEGRRASEELDDRDDRRLADADEWRSPLVEDIHGDLVLDEGEMPMTDREVEYWGLRGFSIEDERTPSGWEGDELD